ncbi:hypothetical protein GGR56DRAFT_691410 [Xylariaceae sp. FL0804]|nr:hypothetical protein GGR56DRAFT_691410 [Xylariaceae sp. FL0804]
MENRTIGRKRSAAEISGASQEDLSLHSVRGGSTHGQETGNNMYCPGMISQPDDAFYAAQDMPATGNPVNHDRSAGNSIQIPGAPEVSQERSEPGPAPAPAIQLNYVFRENHSWLLMAYPISRAPVPQLSDGTDSSRNVAATAYNPTMRSGLNWRRSRLVPVDKPSIQDEAVAGPSSGPGASQVEDSQAVRFPSMQDELAHRAILRRADADTQEAAWGRMMSELPRLQAYVKSLEDIYFETHRTDDSRTQEAEWDQMVLDSRALREYVTVLEDNYFEAHPMTAGLQGLVPSIEVDEHGEQDDVVASSSTRLDYLPRCLTRSSLIGLARSNSLYQSPERYRERQQQSGVSGTKPTAAEEADGTREPRSSPVPGNGHASSPSIDSVEANEEMSPISLCKRLSRLELLADEDENDPKWKGKGIDYGDRVCGATSATPVEAGAAFVGDGGSSTILSFSPNVDYRPRRLTESQTASTISQYIAGYGDTDDEQDEAAQENDQDSGTESDPFAGSPQKLHSSYSPLGASGSSSDSASAQRTGSVTFSAETFAEHVHHNRNRSNEATTSVTTPYPSRGPSPPPPSPASWSNTSGSDSDSDSFGFDYQLQDDDAEERQEHEDDDALGGLRPPPDHARRASTTGTSAAGGASDAAATDSVSSTPTLDSSSTSVNDEVQHSIKEADSDARAEEAEKDEDVDQEVIEEERPIIRPQDPVRQPRGPPEAVPERFASFIVSTSHHRPSHSWSHSASATRRGVRHTSRGRRARNSMFVRDMTPIFE